MSDLISYPAALGLHILAVAVFLSGLLLAGLMLPSLARAGTSAAETSRLRRFRAWNSFVTTPALGFVWLFGTTLAVEAGWLAALWLKVKIALVVLLSALHGIQSGRLRRLSRTHGAGGQGSYWPVLVAVLVVVGILLLVTVKPW